MIPPEELEWSCEPTRPPGGQQAGMPPQRITVRHKPTGLTASVENMRSQHRMREIALDMLLAGLTHPRFEL